MTQISSDRFFLIRITFGYRMEIFYLFRALNGSKRGKWENEIREEKAKSFEPFNRFVDRVCRICLWWPNLVLKLSICPITARWWKRLYFICCTKNGLCSCCQSINICWSSSPDPLLFIWCNKFHPHSNSVTFAQSTFGTFLSSLQRDGTSRVVFTDQFLIQIQSKWSILCDSTVSKVHTSVSKYYLVL